METKLAVSKLMYERQLITQLPEIRLNDRILIVGRTGTGKSILAHSLFKSIPIPRSDKEAESNPFWRICVDVTDSVYDDSLTFYDPINIPWEESFSLRFVPDAERMEQSIDDLYLSVMAHGSCWIWCDECNEVSTAHRTIPGMRRILLQGRKFQIGHAGVTPRPVDITRSLITQSEHLFSFALTDPDDRVKISKNMNLSPDEFEERLAELPPFGYLWYAVRENTLFSMPPLPIEEVNQLE